MAPVLGEERALAEVALLRPPPVRRALELRDADRQRGRHALADLLREVLLGLWAHVLPPSAAASHARGTRREPERANPRWAKRVPGSLGTDM